MKTDPVELARRWVPRRLRYLIQRYFSLSKVKLQYRERMNPHADIDESAENRFKSPYCFGIVKNSAQYHCHYVAACLELGIPFSVLNLAADDWLEQVRQSECDVLLVWPDGFLSIWNEMIKARIEVLEHELGMLVFPSAAEVWLFEDKRRMAYWLQAHSVPHPRTWIFYDQAECLEFVSSSDKPLVFKASFGASASGVRLFHDRRRLGRFVRRVFKRGFVPSGFDRRDRQWGSIILQEYLPGVREWRLVRIGNSYFGHRKGEVAGLHSGAGAVIWDVPEKRHLDFLYEVTKKGGFRSMDVDVFETPEGRLLVNELQTVFGASHSVDQLRVDGEPGRFIREGGTGDWVFEPGDFAKNSCANERIRYVLDSQLHNLRKGDR